jgi:hypothetical protein
VLYETLQKENLANEQDLDLDDITAAANPRCPGASLKAKAADSANSRINVALPPLNPIQERANQVITYEWVRNATLSTHRLAWVHITTTPLSTHRLAWVRITTTPLSTHRLAWVRITTTPLSTHRLAGNLLDTSPMLAWVLFISKKMGRNG